MPRAPGTPAEAASAPEPGRVFPPAGARRPAPPPAPPHLRSAPRGLWGRPPWPRDRGTRGGRPPTCSAASSLGRAGRSLPLYCLRFAPRGTRGPGSAPVPQLRGARRLPRPLTPAVSRCGPPGHPLDTRATRPDSPAGCAAGARRIPRPRAALAPRPRSGPRSRRRPGQPSVLPAPLLSAAAARFLPSCPRPPSLRGPGQPLPMRLC